MHISYIYILYLFMLYKSKQKQKNIKKLFFQKIGMDNMQRWFGARVQFKQYGLAIAVVVVVVVRDYQRNRTS